jgi:hypothetical protein
LRLRHSLMSTEGQLAAFFARHRLLLAKERDEEISRTSLLLSNCGPKLLEQKGLAITGLSIIDEKIGLGGKTYVNLHTSSFDLKHTSLVLSSWRDLRLLVLPQTSLLIH